DCLHDGRIRAVLGQPIARQQPNVLRLFECDQADAIELALEDPFRAREPLLGEGGGHGLEPFAERVGHRLPAVSNFVRTVIASPSTRSFTGSLRSPRPKPTES